MEDPDVMEIPPPPHFTPRFKKQKHKQVIVHDVIDIDGDSDDVVIIGEKESKRNKGKAIAAVYDGYGDHQVMGNGNIIDIASDKFVDVDHEYALLLQAQFDNEDIPPGNSTFNPWSNMQSDAKNSHVMDSLQPSWTLDPTNSKIQGSTVGSSNLQIKMDNVGRYSGTNLSPQLFSQATPSKKKSATSQQSGHDLNLSLGKDSSKSKWSSKSGASKNHGSVDNPEAMKLPHAARDGNKRKALDNPVLAKSDDVNDEILRKLRSFKQFDSVEDAADHHYFSHKSSVKQNPKNWAKKIQDDWKILEKDLPDSIFVRVYESRMDLLRAVIIGAEGTPYHDGLFFFDVHFPSSYPSKPPLVHYHSGGLRLNPNLYACGKVCLSLLNTWSGGKKEKWLPGVSTMLQVLVSIQGLILNTNPFFNEPGYERSRGTENGNKMSLKYNEDTFILSLRTMMYTINRPPKYFEDFVVGHFRSRGHDILMACQTYMEGVQVGCVVKGGVQDVDEGEGSCSQGFKMSLAGYVKKLVQDFEKCGAKDCKKFLLLTEKAKK